MNQALLNRLIRKTGVPEIVDILAGRLSGSELNSLMLEVYGRKAGKIKPAELMAQYRQNRLVQPSAIDMISLLESELESLRFFQERGFQPVELSPLAPFGSCSVVATVDQDKVVSAIRNTEVVADATNLLALHLAAGGQEMRLCTVHRHVRTQPFGKRGFLPHFKVGCVVTGGRDTGNYTFELHSLMEHLETLTDLLRKVYGVGQMRIVLKARAGYDERNPLIEKVESFLRTRITGVGIERGDRPAENAYYQGIQFKLLIMEKGREWEIADGGFVDWTQQLLGNKKERLLISGFGLELLYKLQHGMI